MTKQTTALKKAGELGILSYTNAEAAARNKRGILVVSFGTTYQKSRAKTIDALVAKVKAAYPDDIVISALSSHIIVNKIKTEENIIYPTPEEGIEKMLSIGVDRLAIIPTDIIPGIEYNYLRELFYEYRKHFSKITLGTPLMYYQGQSEMPNDIKNTMQALALAFPECFEMDAVLLMAHGTPHPANSYHAAMQLELWNLGYKNAFVYTVEGTPTIDNMLELLQKRGILHITLLPLMLVAGNHAHIDMLEHKELLESKGFDVNAKLTGIGENKKIQELYLAKAAAAIAELN